MMLQAVSGSCQALFKVGKPRVIALLNVWQTDSIDCQLPVRRVGRPLTLPSQPLILH